MFVFYDTSRCCMRSVQLFILFPRRPPFALRSEVPFAPVSRGFFLSHVGQMREEHGVWRLQIRAVEKEAIGKRRAVRMLHSCVMGGEEVLVNPFLLLWALPLHS